MGYLKIEDGKRNEGKWSDELKEKKNERRSNTFWIWMGGKGTETKE